MELFRFQEMAATQIASRFAEYSRDPLMVSRTLTVPFFQTLIAITGSGKTLILADVIKQINDELPISPIFLWVSKGKVVVSQTLENLSSGKYAQNLPGFDVLPLLEVQTDHLNNSSNPLLLVATVGKFSREDKESGDRKIFQAQFDAASESLWELLKKREDDKKYKRPLIVIYDEGHNLSDLQSERILELAPDGIIAASATMSIPKKLNNTIGRLQSDKGWTDKDLTTSVSSKLVVGSGLVKETISIDGYVTPMEQAVDNMLSDMTIARKAAEKLADPFVPKAIYVCSTNAVDGVPIAEDVKRPFADRQARPILIWRHLVEIAKIDPSKIAVYSQLKFSKDFPAPAKMHLFSGGEKDYEKFIQGNYEHIIFNLGLQEGWDDPACAFAYIDKGMASARQITQVVGRVLRQPQAKHHVDPILNTAHFHIRTDDKGVFNEILEDIRKQLISEHPAVKLVVRNDNGKKVQDRIEPNPPRSVPLVAIESTNALFPIQSIINSMMTFKPDDDNAIGEGSRMQILQRIGSGETAEYDWKTVEHSNRVTVRSIFKREVQRLYPGSLRRSSGGPVNLVDIELPKFDAMVELSSPAADHVRQKAHEVVQAFVQHSYVTQNNIDLPFQVGPVAIDPSSAEAFNRAVHEKYSGLNTLELKFARALDKTKRVWSRNPSNVGYFLPLLGEGKAYFPDFLVWIDKTVIALDTKGDHLLLEASASKIFEIEANGSKSKIVLRLVSEGESTMANGALKKLSNKGYTVWSWRNGKPHAIHCEDETSLMKASLDIS